MKASSGSNKLEKGIDRVAEICGRLRLPVFGGL